MATHRAKRARAAGRRTLGWVAVAIGVIWLVSGWVYFGAAARASGSETTITVDRGVVRVFRMVDPAVPGPTGVQVFGGRRRPPWKGWVRRYSTSGSSLSGAVEVPLWPLLALAISPFVVAWVRRQRFGPGHCPKCGYDLAGLKDGVCPECGSGVRAEVK